MRIEDSVLGGGFLLPYLMELGSRTEQDGGWETAGRGVETDLSATG
jgi:hypothetical protein